MNLLNSSIVDPFSNSYLRCLLTRRTLCSIVNGIESGGESTQHIQIKFFGTCQAKEKVTWEHMKKCAENPSLSSNLHLNFFMWKFRNAKEI